MGVREPWRRQVPEQPTLKMSIIHFSTEKHKSVAKAQMLTGHEASGTWRWHPGKSPRPRCTSGEPCHPCIRGGYRPGGGIPGNCRRRQWETGAIQPGNVERGSRPPARKEALRSWRIQDPPSPPTPVPAESEHGEDEAGRRLKLRSALQVSAPR